MEARISSWVKNEQKHLSIKAVQDYIESHKEIKETMEKYDLRKIFNDIGSRLDDYVHSNGYALYNRNINAYHDGEFLKELTDLVNNATYFTTVFVFLLSLCSPVAIMSSDYIDYLDCGETPPDESQYWVAPFVQNFIKENSSLIDENAYAYLKDKCIMDL